MRVAKLLPAIGLVGLISLGSNPALSDCTCRYKGGEITESQTICMTTAKGRELAVCEKVLNVTSWKFLGQPCPAAAIDNKPITPSAASGYKSG
jgi:hypothetical protein